MLFFSSTCQVDFFKYNRVIMTMEKLTIKNIGQTHIWPPKLAQSFHLDTWTLPCSNWTQNYTQVCSYQTQNADLAHFINKRVYLRVWCGKNYPTYLKKCHIDKSQIKKIKFHPLTTIIPLSLIDFMAEKP